jgi:hypothetical protein
MAEKLEIQNTSPSLDHEQERAAFIAEMLPIEFEPGSPFSEEEKIELLSMKFDSLTEAILVRGLMLDPATFLAREEQRTIRIAEIIKEMLERERVSNKNKETYSSLMEKLADLDENKVDEAIEIAEKIKTMLLESARNTSKGYLEDEVRRLVFIMFNRFRVNDYDNLHEEILAVQKNPVILRYPEQIVEEE